MKRENDINSKNKEENYTVCVICDEHYSPQKDIVILLCCSTDSGLKSFDSSCAEKTFNEEIRCPYCRSEDERLKSITLDYETFEKLIKLGKKELKEILDSGKSQSPETILKNIEERLLTPQQKELRDFLKKTNLLSKEYFDDSPLSVKMKKLLDDKISPYIIFVATEKFINAGLSLIDDINTTLNIICHLFAEEKIEEINLKILSIKKLLDVGGHFNLANEKKEKALSPEQLFSLLSKSTCRLEINIHIAGQYFFQELEANEIEIAIEVWNWIHKNPLCTQEFEKFIMRTENFNYLLNFARTFSLINKSFRNSSEINASSRRAVELLLNTKNNLVLSAAQLGVLEEISEFHEQSLSPQLLVGLKLFLAANISTHDTKKAQKYILQVAKTAWLVGDMPMTQYERDAITSTDQPILYLRKIIFFPHAFNISLHQKCFTFALRILYAYATNKEILALKTLGDYYLKIGKTKEAIDYFLQTKNLAEIMQRQQRNEITTYVLFDSTLALGQLFYESGALVKACKEYSYGPAYIRLAAEYVKHRDENYIFKAVKCYCQALLTSYQPMVKETLKALGTILIANIQIDQKSCFKIIETLAKFIDANKHKFTEPEISLLLKLIRGLKLEKLFLKPAIKTKTKSKFELFAYKFSSKTRFSTAYAHAFILLIENKDIIDATWEIIEKYGNEKIMTFYQQIWDQQDQLPHYLIDTEISQRVNQILSYFKVDLLDIPPWAHEFD